MRQGYIAMTKPYALESKNANLRETETIWFHRVIDDMRGCDCVLVEFTGGTEVWRHKSELNVTPDGRMLGTVPEQMYMKRFRNSPTIE
jgi:hypothetical protein